MHYSSVGDFAPPPGVYRFLDNDLLLRWTCQSKRLRDSICSSVSLYVSLCVSVCLSVCLSIYLYVCMSVCLSIYLSVCLSVCLSSLLPLTFLPHFSPLK